MGRRFPNRLVPALSNYGMDRFPMLNAKNFNKHTQNSKYFY